MSTIEQSIEVNAPLTTVYNQWTQFEEFPRFMDGVEEVRQHDDTHRRVQGDLERFKEMIERRGRESGAWRGEVKRPDAA